jgi:nucleotide-binding universal stress UspA family protein
MISNNGRPKGASVASYRKVLVGTDGSDSSFRAVDRAGQVAAASGANLILVCAYLAGDREVDLVVVGNRGLNSLAGRLLGSVPANLSHRAHCDVLIVHTTDGK